MDEKYTANFHGSFSDRNKIKPLDVPIQTGELNDRTRNMIVTFIHEKLDYIFRTEGSHNEIKIANKIMAGLYGKPICSRSQYDKRLVEMVVVNTILEGDYDEVFNVMEYFCRMVNYLNPQSGIYEYVNRMFQRECVGYSFINKELTSISSEQEKAAIEESLNVPFGNYASHIAESLHALSDRKHPNYENSIQSAVKGLEELVNRLLGETGNSLGDGIRKVGEQKGLHQAFVKAISNLFGFASDENGLRHGNGKEAHKLDFDEAKCILLLCCTVANYLVSLYKD